MDAQHTQFLIIGAGMAGLSCASQIAGAGRAVRVLDKGRGPGGRMAARRTEIVGKTVSFDHGAQYFTARDPLFQDQIGLWRAQGVVAPWPAAGKDAWVGTPGMNGPIRAMAEQLDVRWNVRAEKITRKDGVWHVLAGDQHFSCDTLLVAIPAEQASVLLNDQASELASIAGHVRSEPCWAVMAGFAQELAIDADCLRDPDGAISWAARNSSKPGRSAGAGECWVLHASPQRSRDILDLGKEEVADLLLADFFTQTGTQPVAPVHLAAHRWLYAMPSAIKGEPSRYDPAMRVGIAGDYLHSPRVEGAWISGQHLAASALATV